MSPPEPDASTFASRRGLRTAAILGAIAALAIVVAGITARAIESSRLRTWTEAQALPIVAASTPRNDSGAAGLELPGRIEAYASAPIYARVSGYLKSWKKDIGAHVKAGELLAEIETPDLDQQLLQARAAFASAQANVALAQTTATRWTSLLASGSVAKQDVDEKVSDLAAKQAMVRAAQANVDLLVATKGFARIVAPFDGTVTARNTDVGALINAGGGNAPQLFVVSNTRTVRVYVNVPQSQVPMVPPGTKATLTVPEHADKAYAGTVVSSAQAVNAASGTTLMQLSVDNAAGELMPGSFANVRLQLPAPVRALSVPASALIFDARGLFVATVDANQRVKLKAITIARDLGKFIEVGSGLDATDRVIESPPDGISDGTQVTVADNPKAGAAATAR
ncbi:MAG: efflux RND transporter periplasmic adaptor subunit [Proteobacteria bacterium]|nr:efflux RND transporter periplasmic adaptor subunit [Pseudomonadota bacterium]